MKKEWQKPVLEVLGIDKTMAGPGLRWDDLYNDDPDYGDHDHHS